MTESAQEELTPLADSWRQETRNRRFRFVEMYVWVLFAMAGLTRVLMAVGEAPVQVIIDRYYGDLLLSFFVVMFPVLFQLVFGHLPLETLRRRKFAPTTYAPADEPLANIARAERIIDTRPDSQPFPAPSTADSLMSGLAQSSERLADGIYSRSGVYLLVGVMVAFSGLAFFYLQTRSSFTTNDLTSLLVSLAPKFGILFFIEFVALFFLRQYRTSMDEFRYYEAIKRHREEILVLLKVGNEQDRPIDAIELVKLGQFFSIAGRLRKEESTEIIEARKLEKNETAVLEKAIDAITQARK